MGAAKGANVETIDRQSEREIKTRDRTNKKRQKSRDGRRGNA